MRRTAILVLLVASALSACASPPAPRAASGMAWTLMNVEGEGAKLAYGTPNSDDVALMMVCEPGSGLIEVYGEGERSLQLTAADRSVSTFARTGQARFGRELHAPDAPRATAAAFVKSCRA